MEWYRRINETSRIKDSIYLYNRDMDPLKILQKYYDTNSLVYKILIEHSNNVTKKAITIAKRVPELHPDLAFIQEAAMLHDIGICLTNDPDLWCSWEHHYICHGYLGREILEKEGLPKHALVAERHTGVWLSLKDREKDHLPIPKRDMIPTTVEEEIICFADKFFSKTKDELGKEKNKEEIRKELAKFGKEKSIKFDEWCKKYKEE